MILILSEERDQSTNNVIDWLNYYNKKFIRVNTETQIEVESFSISNHQENIVLKQNNLFFNMTEINYTWFRRGVLSFYHRRKYTDNNYFNRMLSNHIKDEAEGLQKYIYKKLEKKRHLGTHSYSVIKLDSLITAKACGLKIPETEIVSNKVRLNDIKENSEQPLICKSIQKGVMIELENDILTNYTSEFNLNDKDIPYSFFPTLLQKKVEKKYELRIFYINGTSYSMAIFSQQNEQTAVDFRKYDNKNPNRKVSYNLPDEIDCKLNKFMIAMGLSTGSIDMIYTENEEYIFLEVNPIGQYDMVSFPCNYQLDKVIAKSLIC
jgi:ATP-GRASP peptide maturase of grasp-with-spasm system